MVFYWILGKWLNLITIYFLLLRLLLVLLSLKLILIIDKRRLILIKGYAKLLIFLINLSFSYGTHNLLSYLLILPLLNGRLLQLDRLYRLILNLDWLKLDRYLLDMLVIGGRGVLLRGLIGGRFQVLLRLLGVKRNLLNLGFYLWKLLLL